MLRYDLLQVIDGHLLVGELVALRPKALARKDLGREVVRRAVATTKLSSETRPVPGLTVLLRVPVQLLRQQDFC